MYLWQGLDFNQNTEKDGQESLWRNWYYELLQIITG